MGGLEDAVNDVWDSVEDVAESAWDTVEDIGAEVFSWIGLESTTEIVTDISISGLLTAGLADSSARKAVIRQSKGNSDAYIQSYKTFQREYKTRYNKKFLENLGYLPNSTATTRVLDQSLVLTYLQGVDPLAVEIELMSIRYCTVEEIAWDWMEDNIGWSNYSKKATVGGSEFDVVITDQGATIDMDLSQNYVISITENLTANYGYIEIDSTVEIGGLLYDVPLLDNTDLGGYYRTTVLQQNDGVTTVDIDTTIPTHHYDIAGTLDDDQKLLVKYNRGGTEWYYYTENSASIPSNLYTEQAIDVTAIIALKEDNTIENLENQKTRRMLDKLGLSGDTFIDTLNNNDLDSAYLMTGISPDTQTHAGKMTVYNMFDLIVEGSGDLSISIDRLNMTYSFTLDKTVVNANVMEVGTYSNVLETASDSQGTTFYRRILRYQATPTQYRQIIVTNFLLTYQISGQQIEVTFASPSDLRLVLPLNVFNNLKYRDWVDVYEQSLCMLAYSYEEVRLKWYESPAFAIIMKIVAVVVTILTWYIGGASVGAAIWALAVGVGLSYAIELIVDVMIDMGFSPELAYAVGAVLAIVATMYNPNAGTEVWLNIAVIATNSVNQLYAYKTEQIKLADEENLNEHLERMEHLKDQQESLRNSDDFVVQTMQIANERVGGMSELEKIEFSKNVALMCDTSSLYDIDYQINKRIRVSNVV